jgi:nucleoside-diphosphate-sugar epimerase
VKVFVADGTGAIGGHAFAALVGAGHDETALAHGTMSAKESTMINQLLGDPAGALALAIAPGPVRNSLHLGAPPTR